ncbi:iron-sulfur cluster assembly scaffold protein [Aurantiacibacter odishensis]|uniref:iron-sulfur cluster assembly scaffold protein n=1 Tax=Aurantiacibacter odishensis TaxID=1155476 RepID=UPI00196B921F|nr:iron-sulfur cluster assembly scaffold protein [Aurantiacibacter odishensis]
MSAERLYTPRMLSAAVELANMPPLAEADTRGSARSPACGSTMELDLGIDGQDRIAVVGMKVRACAVGQAAAAIFARHARGKSAADIDATLEAMAAWLDSGGTLPNWPDLDLIAPARDYPGRHGAMLLPWKAASEALSSANAAG